MLTKESVSKKIYQLLILLINTLIDNIKAFQMLLFSLVTSKQCINYNRVEMFEPLQDRNPNSLNFFLLIYHGILSKTKKITSFMKKAFLKKISKPTFEFWWSNFQWHFFLNNCKCTFDKCKYLFKIV